MRRLVLLAGPIAGLALVGTAVAVNRPALDVNAISSVQCTTSGSGAKLVVDVTYKLTNYGDAGYASEWALDSVNRHLRIWKHSDGTYCAQVSDDGSSFVTIAGPSPNGSGYVAGGITGTFDGGYVTTDIVGKFKPTYATQGDLGTFDTKCDLYFNCSGPHPSWLSYFKNPTAQEFVDWGWQYTTQSHGTWLDQGGFVSPRDGDIK